MDALTNAELSELIGEIYECALEPAQWPHTLRRIAEDFTCNQAILSLNDLSSDQALIFQSVGWEPHWLETRAQHLPEIHAALGSWLEGREGDQSSCFIASREIPDHIRDESAYELKCLRPQGIADVMHCFLVRTSATFSELVLGFSQDVGPVSQHQIELAQLLLPHLRRAVTVSNVLDANTLLRTQLSRTLDALSCAIFLTNEDCDVVHANMAATALLKEQHGVAVRGKRLTVPHHATRERELRHAVRLCHGDAMQLQQLGIAIRLTDLPPFVFAHVLPLQCDGFQESLPARAVAAVFVRTGVLSHQDIDRIGAAFRLTSAEKLIASTLLAGHSLTEAAAQLGVARTTAKTHLENIFQKSGVTRQADFIRLALLAVPPH